MPQVEATMICVVNKSAQALAKNPVYQTKQAHRHKVSLYPRMHCQKRGRAQICEISWSNCEFLHKASQVWKFSKGWDQGLE